MNRKVLLLVVIVMMVVGNVWAADPNWNGSTSIAWSNGLNWTPNGAPTSISKATVNNVGTYDPTISSGTADVNQLFVAESAGNVPGALTVTVSGGKLKANQEIVLGYGDTDNGTLLVSGTGDVNSNHLLLGFNPGSTGNLHIDGGIVNVRQMFGLSWNGGTGNATLDGGTLQTEQFTFEKVDGGTASMNITGGKWIQKHFWYNEIKSLVWYGKIKGHGGNRANVVVTWKPAGIGQTEVTSVAAPTEPNLIIVKKDGLGDYTTIQDALNATVKGSVVEVRDSGVYTENLQFKASTPSVDANYVTLQAGSGLSTRPTIRLTGIDSNSLKYISMNAAGTTIQGFKIDFTGSGSTTDGNSTIINSVGGASTVRDCIIVGPAAGRVTGIRAVANIEGVDVSSCWVGVICDLNSVQTGTLLSGTPYYSIKNSDIHGNRKRGILLSDCNAVMDECEIYQNGNSSPPPIGLDSSGNMMIDGNEPSMIGRTGVLIKNSTIRNSNAGRNINVETTGIVTIEDSIIRDAPNNDCILQYGGTLNLTRCLFHVGEAGAYGRAALIQAANGQWNGGKTNFDHCTIEGDEARPIPSQWAILSGAPNADVTIKNSIVIAAQGLFESSGTMHTNFNDVFCSATDYEAQGPVAGANDISVDPFYIQTTDEANETTYYVPQPYSPVAHADEDGNSMGWKEPVTGYEKWPADLDGLYGIDFKDFAKFASTWDANYSIAAGPNDILDAFESYTATGIPGQALTLLGPRTGETQNAWRVVPNSWYGTSGWTHPKIPAAPDGSTITLLTNPADVYSGTKAMRWVYDVNAHYVKADPNCFSTEILVVLPHAEDMNTAPGSTQSRFNNLKLMLKRHADNSPDAETFMYVRLLDRTRDGVYPNVNRDDIIKTIVGGSTAQHPDEWYLWSIPLNAGTFNVGDDVDEGSSKEQHMSRIDAIILGIQSQPDGPYGDGKGTIDVDLIELVDTPACPVHPIGDIYPAGPVGSGNGDCIVDFMDLREFVKYWLDGQP